MVTCYSSSKKLTYYVSIWAAVTKDHRLGSLHTQRLFLSVLEAGLSSGGGEVLAKVAVYLGPGEGSHPKL